MPGAGRVRQKGTPRAASARPSAPARAAMALLVGRFVEIRNCQKSATWRPESDMLDGRSSRESASVAQRSDRVPTAAARSHRRADLWENLECHPTDARSDPEARDPCRRGLRSQLPFERRCPPTLRSRRSLRTRRRGPARTSDRDPSRSASHANPRPRRSHPEV